MRIIQKILDKQAQNVIEKGEKRLRLIETDDQLTRELNLLPLHNNLCHYNTAALYRNLCDKYDIDIHVCIYVEQSPIVHFINSIKIDGEYKYVDPTFSWLGKRGKYLVILDDEEENSNPISMLNIKGLKFLETPEIGLYFFKTIMFKFFLARNFKSKRVKDFIKENDLVIRIFNPLKYL